MNQSIIQTRNLNKVYNKGGSNEVRAVQDVTLNIGQNSVSLFRGPSGSGKSTLLSILGGLSRPTSGDLICLDENLSHWSEKFLTGFRRQHIGMIFQNFNLINNLSACDNIATPLIPQALSLKTIRQRVERVASIVKVEHRLHFKAGSLSGGEQQRVAIARALISEPEILIADEPTAHLDSALSDEILDIFRILKSDGKTILIATHDPVLNEHPLIDRVYCIKDGRLEPEYAC